MGDDGFMSLFLGMVLSEPWCEGLLHISNMQVTGFHTCYAGQFPREKEKKRVWQAWR